MGEQNLLYLCNESENQNSASYKFLGMDQSACSYKLFGLNAFLDRQTFHYITLHFFQGTDTLSRKKQQKALKSVRYT